MPMHRHFEEQIADCKSCLVQMGAQAERMIGRAIESLLERNPDMHAEVFEQEKQVNEWQREVDERVVSIIALQHPVAADLRLLIVCSKIASEVERIGDKSITICNNTCEVLKYPMLKPLIDIPRMAEMVRGMVRDSLDAFVREDVELAQKVLETDEIVDGYKEQISRELLTYMMAEPTNIPRAMPLILISRNLERVGDHTANIAEDVIFVAQGRDVRHHHDELKHKEQKA